MSYYIYIYTFVSEDKNIESIYCPEFNTPLQKRTFTKLTFTGSYGRFNIAFLTAKIYAFITITRSEGNNF